MRTLFDDLSDLALIELFSYLSCADVLYGLTYLNHRLTALIAERASFRHVNLSSIRRRQFNTILCRLAVHDIETLVIDCAVSPLQLLTWPYLPRLTTLRLTGVRNFTDVAIFVAS